VFAWTNQLWGCKATSKLQFACQQQFESQQKQTANILQCHALHCHVAQALWLYLFELAPTNFVHKTSCHCMLAGVVAVKPLIY